MADAVFFRLTDADVDAKAAALERQIAALNAGEPAANGFTADGQAFRQIPGSPFAYWVSAVFRALFQSHKVGDISDPKQGLATTDDFRFVRCWWESYASHWYGFAKGGAYSPFYSDVHLVVDWAADGTRIKESICRKYPYLNNKWEWVAKNSDHYFRPGLTWPRRTNGFSVRALPAGCIFADKGPSVFVADDDPDHLLALAAIMNSALFGYLVRLQLARTELAQSYEVGLIQQTPVPERLDDRLAPLARRAHDVQRERFLSDETTHVFHLPALVSVRAGSLAAAASALAAQEAERARQLADAQAQIDAIVFDLYGLNAEDRQAVLGEPSSPARASGGAGEAEDDEPDDGDEAPAPNDLPAQVLNLLMWCVGVAFGRWDVRKALDPSRFPPLPGPFDPLPRCAPGALMNADGLPAAQTDVPDDHPLPIAWDGILVDDPAQEANPRSLDIAARVRGVITLLWGEARAEAIEAEICRTLGYRDLRAIFRDARGGLFAFHIKRYSKSRRKAPIYWLLQPQVRSPNYGIWLYYPRLHDQTLFIAEEIAYRKVVREKLLLDELRQGLDGLERAARKQREAEIAAQSRLVDEVTDFQMAVRRLANLGLPPDHNDGVLISIAPLHELVPWKEAAAMWTKLTRGEYGWSTMSQRMRARGLLADQRR